MRRALLALLVLVAGCGGAESAREAVTPRGGDPVAHLRALQRIADASGGDRAAGTDGDRRTIEYIERTLRAAGWNVRFQDVSFPFFELRRRPRLGDLRRGTDFDEPEYSSTSKSVPRRRSPSRGLRRSSKNGNETSWKRTVQPAARSVRAM